MSGLKPIFNLKSVQNIFTDYIDERVNREVIWLQRIGESFVNEAKQFGNYKDRTANLRNSIGYIIIWDGKIIKQKIGNKAESKSNSLKFIEEIQSKYPSGMVLIGFAGMNYAAAVESKGYDVITGSTPTQEILKQSFEKYFKSK